MFRLSKERQMQIDAAYRLYFPGEDVEQSLLVEWTPDLDEYVTYIPVHFHKAIANRTLVTNKELYKQFTEWCQEIIDQQHEEGPSNWESIVTKLHNSAQVIFNGTLHDAIIVKLKRRDSNITLYLDGTAGFNAYSFVELTFENVRTEKGDIGYYYIYDELVNTEYGFGYRLLSDNPYKEWTIEFENAHAKYVYNPVIKDNAEQFETVQHYVAALNPDFHYAVKVDNELIDCELGELICTDEGCLFKEMNIGKTVAEIANSIYTFEYENPHAHFSEPVLLEDLYSYALSNDLTLRVRAYNTLYEQGEEASQVANEILRDSVLTEDNEMILSVIAGHFHSMGLLDDDNQKKYNV